MIFPYFFVFCFQFLHEIINLNASKKAARRHVVGVPYLLCTSTQMSHLIIKIEAWKGGNTKKATNQTIFN